MQLALPAGFRAVASGRHTLVVAEDLADDVASLGLLEAGGLEQCFAGASGGEGRARTAVVAPSGAPPRLLLRRLVHGGLLGPLLRGAYWGMGRAITELHVNAELHRAGAPVPRPALALGRRLAGPIHACTVGTVFEESSVDLLVFLRSKPDPRRLLSAAAATGSAVRAFHDAGGRHADLHVKNLLIREGPSGPQCIVIDLDKARVTAGLTPGERMTQLMRLFRSLWKREVMDVVGARGCARFLSSYCDDDRLLRRALWKRVPAELRVVALHRIRY